MLYILLSITVPPTHTDSSVFIRILRDIYGHTDTEHHHKELRLRIYAAGVSSDCECEAYGDVSLTSSDSNPIGPSSKRAKV